MAPAVIAAAATALAAAALLSPTADAVTLRAAPSRDAGSNARHDYDAFVRRFGRRQPPAGSQEHQHRLALFEASVQDIRDTNARNSKEGRLWRAGFHPFMDWSRDERSVLNGYRPNRARSPAGSVSLLNSGTQGFLRGRANSTRTWDESELEEQGGLSAEAGPALRNQGDCGSCWAISAVEAVEAQLQRLGLVSAGGARLSAQALVDCVPNPEHCGGTGGCDGATGELAYSFMRDHGIPLEADLPYRARTQTCPDALAGPWQAAQRVRVGGWSQLPSNQAAPLMKALSDQGPVVVAVDGNQWFNYESGIFDDCAKDATLGHAVLAKGYGTDGGNKYWLIQNSWGSDWGEAGHIRLLRHDSEDDWCGTDRKPQEGVGCDGGPSEITVCGTCGLLYDPIVPTGVRLEASDGGDIKLSASLARFSSGLGVTRLNFGNEEEQDDRSSAPAPLTDEAPVDSGAFVRDMEQALA